MLTNQACDVVVGQRDDVVAVDTLLPKQFIRVSNVSLMSVILVTGRASYQHCIVVSKGLGRNQSCTSNELFHDLIIIIPCIFE